MNDLVIQCVKLLYNFTNEPYDKYWYGVALNSLDKIYFTIDPAVIENKDEVLNYTDNKLGIEGYLDDKIVAKRYMIID